MAHFCELPSRWDLGGAEMLQTAFTRPPSVTPSIASARRHHSAETFVEGIVRVGTAFCAVASTNRRNSKVPRLTV